jgi:putative DNA primase/helicase
MTEQQTNIVGFPKTEEVAEEEKARRIMAEATRLAGLSPGEWKIWIGGSAERLGITRDTLEAVVIAVFKDREKKQREDKAEARRIEQRAEKTKKEGRQEERQQEREQQRIEKEAARQAEQEQRRLEKEQERKEKERAKALNNLLKLPVAQHEKGLERIAAQLGEDVGTLRDELDELLGLECGDAFTLEKTEPWPDAVDAATVLDECAAKFSRYVVWQAHQLTTAVLWAAHAWLYDHDVIVRSPLLVHSPILALTSAEPDSGKTTAGGVTGRACPRLSMNVEITGPSLFRFVDARKPTMVLSEADDLFDRRSDLKHIVNAGWTRGWKIPRQARINGIFQTVQYDPFCPKILDLLGRNLPSHTRTRCIELRMLPKRPDEQVEDFNQADDVEFAILRRKFTRLLADNVTALKDAKPNMSGLNNRLAKNWRPLFAIAELAGGDWPKRVREAAEHLSRKGRRPSDGVQLLAGFCAHFVENRAIEVTSENIIAALAANPTGRWAGYNRGGPITKIQVANLLDPYDIDPVPLHPTKRKNFARQGYKILQFADAFARYLPPDPMIQSLIEFAQSLEKKKPRLKHSSSKKRKPAKGRKHR